jgi:hypothetical protein
MGRTTVLVTLHGSKHPVLGASARRPILVYQAATSEEKHLRIPLLLRGWMNKDHQASLRFLINEEHTVAKPVRCGPEAGLGIHILRPTLFEPLVCVGKLAGSEPLTSAGCHDDARRHG